MSEDLDLVCSKCGKAWKLKRTFITNDKGERMYETTYVGDNLCPDCFRKREMGVA